MAHFESNDKDKGAHFRFDNSLIHVKTSNINLLHHTSPMQYKQDYFISFNDNPIKLILSVDLPDAGHGLAVYDIMTV